MNKKKKILFVGSFIQEFKDKRAGGQMAACGAIINSDLNDYITWILLDTSAILPIQHILIRFFKALKRIIVFIFHLISKDINGVLIFSSSGVSFLEKGLMAIIAKSLGNKVYYAPRSGLILNDLESKWKTKYISTVFSKCEKVVCQSEKWKTKFIDNTQEKDSDKYVVIPNWVDHELYLPTIDNSENKKKTTIIYLGWVKDYKGIFDLLSALLIIRDALVNVEVLICGDGDDKEKAIKFCKNNSLDNIVSFKGWIGLNEKLEYFSYSDIFVLPSHFEGFPNALLEAMSSGIATIATDVGAVSDVIDDGVNGILIKPHSQKELSTAIQKLVKDEKLRYKFSVRARKTITDNYIKKQSMNKFKEILIYNGK